ncbi:MAG: DUF262 domain-containing protein [Deltaproteobacteria bacterium]|nr:DUF262 domain-containing protein [Deltaproteobacteria bacterium]
MSKFYTLDEKLPEILKQIHQGELQLPDFQRGWVWDDNRIRELIASVASSFPMGAMMLLEYSPQTKFNYRHFVGTAAATEPKNLVLDGQQRLTSLYNAFYSQNATVTIGNKGKEIKRFYYIDIEKALTEPASLLDAVVSVPEDRKIRENFDRDVTLDLSSPELEFKSKMFPLNKIFNDLLDVWQEGFFDFYEYNSDIVKLLTKFKKVVVRPVESYESPIIHLPKDTPKAAVCQVFEKVNTGGVTLNVFELVTAIFASDEFDLRTDWEKRSKEMRKKDMHDVLRAVDSSSFLAAVTLLTRYSANREARLAGVPKPPAIGCKREDILDLPLDKYRLYADPIEHGFKQAAEFLLGEFVFSRDHLPYSTQLIPLAVIMAAKEMRKGEGKIFDESETATKISTWYWCGVLGELYHSSNETRFVNDVTGMMDWLEGGTERPDTVARAFFQPERLLTLKTRNAAAYKGITALILKDGARDFLTGKKMEHELFFSGRYDIHHIFPKAYCSESDIDEDRRDCIVNKTPISSNSNKTIGGIAPSKYLKRIVKTGHVSEENIREFVSSHQVNFPLLAADKFDSFFIDRAKALIVLVARAMGKPVEGLDSDDVVNGFGASLA